MPVSSVRVTEGSGPYLHTWQRTVASVNREEQYVQIAEPALPTFSVVASGISTATAASHLLQIMAPASACVRIHRIRVEQFANATSASANSLSVVRLTTAGTGGVTLVPRPFDTSDTSGATAMTLPTAKGTEGVELLRTALVFRQAIATTQAQLDETWEWTQAPGRKPIIIPPGTANGIAITNPGAIAGATVMIYVEFAETAWL